MAHNHFFTQTTQLTARDELIQKIKIGQFRPWWRAVRLAHLAGISFGGQKTCLPSCPVSLLSVSVWANLESYHDRDVRFGFVFAMYVIVMYVEVTMRSKSFLFS